MHPPTRAAAGGESETRGWRARAFEGVAHLPRALGLVWRSSPTATLALAGFSLLLAALPVGMAYVGKRIIDAIGAGDRDGALWWVLIELGAAALQLGLHRGQALTRTLLGARLGIDINVSIIEKALTLELPHFEDPTTYDLLTRARREALVAAAVPATVAEMRFSAQGFRMRNWRSPDGRKLNYLEYVLANDGHAKEVKLFGLGPLLLGRFKALGERFYRDDRDLARRRALWGGLLGLLSALVLYACYAGMALRAASGALTLGDVTLYMVALRQGQQAFQSALGAVGAMFENGLYLSNLSQFLALPSRAGGGQAPASVAGAANEAVRDERGVRFEGVGFRYPGREGWALREVSFFVPEGQALALVGHNGAGKTTIIKLLTGLYEPSEGRVLIDGRPLEDWGREALQARVGVVFQDFNRYQFTARENVGFGDVGRLDDAERLDRAVERGGATPVVGSLPQGLETQLGKWFREGVELSGGQWQAVALARSFMREGADILVLDEPTAALDAQAEHAVFERFRALTKGRTTFLISHRFPTVRMADRIVVLDGGRVVEDGTHDRSSPPGAATPSSSPCKRAATRRARAAARPGRRRSGPRPQPSRSNTSGRVICEGPRCFEKRKAPTARRTLPTKRRRSASNAAGTRVVSLSTFAASVSPEAPTRTPRLSRPASGSPPLSQGPIASLSSATRSPSSSVPRGPSTKGRGCTN
ncbi:MAG: ABC transporter ATP-binding protein/permease, partial [Polyangiaceae bacterium]|nr:ABC transporter ATP-binding protein/permease [Polyangiaceae bacterium]